MGTLYGQGGGESALFIFDPILEGLLSGKETGSQESSSYLQKWFCVNSAIKRGFPLSTMTTNN